MLQLFDSYNLLFPALNVVYVYVTAFRRVPNMAVFCSSLISCFPGNLFRFFLNDFVIVPIFPIISGLLLLLLLLSLISCS
jgi:hypothetical protein